MNTLAVPSQADYFAVATSVDEVRDACAWAASQQLPVRVLGGGSNVIPDAHIAALVLKPNIRGVAPLKATSEQQWIEVGAGETWHQLVNDCLERGWYGLENLSLIPGTVGAAPIQNIGAYGVELSQVLDSLDAVHIATGELHTFDAQRCAFGYRDSAFKNRLQGQYVITQVRLCLSLQPHLKLDYPGLRDYFGDLNSTAISSRDVSDAVCALRRSKLPDPSEVPNCGSFFKNPVISETHYQQLRQRFPEIVSYDATNGKKLAAGWLIERAGWKGRSYEGVRVHERQALVLTNPGRLPSAHILAAASAIQADIERMFDIVLEIEPQRLS